MRSLKNTINHPYTKSAFLLFLISMLGNVGNYFFTVFAGRTLGPDLYSTVSVFFSYTSLLLLPVAIFQTIITNEIAKQEGKQADRTARIFILYLFKTKRGFLFVYSLALCILLPLLTTIIHLTPIESLLLGTYVSINIIISVYTSVLQGLGLFAVYGLLSFIGVIAKLLGVVIDRGTVGLFIVIGITSLIHAFVIRLIVNKKTKKPNDSVSLITIEPVTFSFSHIISVSISLISISLYNTLDMIMAKQILSSHDAGIYASWSLFGKVIFYAIGPIAPILFVYFSKRHVRKGKSLLYFTLLVLVITLILLGIYHVAGVFLIRLLFSNRFDAVIPYVMYAPLYGLGYAIIHIFYMFFLAQNSRLNIFFALTQGIYIIGALSLPRDILSFLLFNIVFGMAVSVVYMTVSRLDIGKADV